MNDVFPFVGDRAFHLPLVTSVIGCWPIGCSPIAFFGRLLIIISCLVTSAAGDLIVGLLVGAACLLVGARDLLLGMFLFFGTVKATHLKRDEHKTLFG